MSDLRARLASKARRRATVSVAVSDATEAVERATKLQRELFLLNTKKDTKDEIDAKQVELDAVRDEIATHYVDVEFQACRPADFEALQTDFTSEDGGVDAGKLSANLPALIVACVVDDDLRDEEFWREQLESGSWAYGERVMIANRLIGLNVSAPDERIPFA